MALNPGQTSGLVRSQFGYHIIQTEAKQPAHTKPLAEVHDSIVAALESRRPPPLHKTTPTSSSPKPARTVSTRPRRRTTCTSSPPTTSAKDGVIPSLPDSTALLTAAFGAAKGAAPQSASTGDGYAVFQVLDVKAAHAPDFASWKSHVLDDYRDQKAPELLNAQLIKLADRAKVLNDLTKAAAEMKLPVKTSDLVGRDAQVPDLGSMSGPASVLFSLPKGGISGPINEGPNGTVAQVVDKQEPTADDIAKNLARDSREAPRAAAAGGLRRVRRILLQRYQQSGGVVYSQHSSPAACRRISSHCVRRGPASRPRNAYVLRFRSGRE